MFENVGQKIKVSAKVVCVVQFIVYIALGIVCCVNGADESDGLIAVGVFLIVLGLPMAWFNSLLVYGFGELIVKTTQIARSNNTRVGADIKSTIQSKAEDERTIKLEKLRAEGLITEDEYKEAINRGVEATK